ncbi:MAG: hypothetical protein M3Y57_12420 [Acidobacteriota bacterium]|nr:hypothetical protein [Acidobacteriota bacterium]
MADKEPSATTKQLKQDALVEHLIPDPGNPEPTTQLSGWLGKGAREGVWRLYLTPELDQYVQFSETDVVHSQPFGTGESSLGGTNVWLKAGAALEHMQMVKRQVQADFLSGGITSGYMAGSDFSYANARTAKPVPTNSRGYQCSANPHIPACQPPTQGCWHQTVGIACGTGPFCGSGAFVCGQTAGCSVGRECSVGC